MEGIEVLPIEEAPTNEFVLVICKSNHWGIDYVVLTAKLVDDIYLSWRDETGTRLSEGGYEPLGWTKFPSFNWSGQALKGILDLEYNRGLEAGKEEEKKRLLKPQDDDQIPF